MTVSTFIEVKKKSSDNFYWIWKGYKNDSIIFIKRRIRRFCKFLLRLERVKKNKFESFLKELCSLGMKVCIQKLIKKQEPELDRYRRIKKGTGEKKIWQYQRESSGLVMKTFIC